MQEVRARGAHVIAVATEGDDRDRRARRRRSCAIPRTDWMLAAAAGGDPAAAARLPDRARARAERRPAAQPRQDRHGRVTRAWRALRPPASRSPGAMTRVGIDLLEIERLERRARAPAGGCATRLFTDAERDVRRRAGAARAAPGRALLREGGGRQGARAARPGAGATSRCWAATRRRGDPPARGRRRAARDALGVQVQRLADATRDAATVGGRSRCAPDERSRAGWTPAARTPRQHARRPTRWAIDERGIAVARADGARGRRGLPTLVDGARPTAASRSCAARATTAATATSPRGCCASGPRGRASCCVADRRAAGRRRRQRSSGCPARRRGRSRPARSTARPRSSTRCSAPGFRGELREPVGAAIAAVNAALARPGRRLRRPQRRRRVQRRGRGRRRSAPPPPRPSTRPSRASGSPPASPTPARCA